MEGIGQPAGNPKRGFLRDCTPGIQSLGGEKMKEKILEDQWVVGFIDALGKFIVDVKEDNIELKFVVNVPKEDVQTLYKLKKIFQCGRIYEIENGWCLEIRKIHCIKNVVEYFDKHWLKTRKRVDFIKFRKIYLILERGQLMEKLEDVAKYAEGIRGTPREVVDNILKLKGTG